MSDTLRPFYGEYAWAFDLLIDRPVAAECAAIAAWLSERGVPRGSMILDAGCGSGRYAIELARLGWVVRGVDLSTDLIDLARKAGADSSGTVSFDVGDIVRLAPANYAGILCRGVLNDITLDADRDAVFDSFAGGLRAGGVLVLDVREWNASVARKTREPVVTKRVSTPRGELTFTSDTAIDPEKHALVISERHELTGHGERRVSDHRFVMRCWERAELDGMLQRHGFVDISCYGAYDAGVTIGSTDRIVAVARRYSAD